MTESIFDYPAINRRLNRKPEPIVAVAVDDDYERAKKCIFGNPDCQVCNAQTNVSKLRAFLAKPLELTPESLGYVPPPEAYGMQAGEGSTTRSLPEGERVGQRALLNGVEMKWDGLRWRPAKRPSMPTLRAEVEQMEQEQDILGLRLKADEAMKHAREQARTAVFDEFGSRDELMKLWGA